MIDFLRLLGGLLVDVFRSHAAREAEIAFLRQQLVVLQRSAGEGFRMPARGDLSARAEGRRPKASQEGTRGGRATACRLWRFDDAAACVVDALAGAIGGGSTIAVASLARPRQSTGQF
jgi:hypothetical protein